MRRHALALTAATAALALAACSGGGGVEEGTEPPASFTFADWSIAVEPQGDWVTSMANEEVRVDVYLLGIEPAPEDSSWGDSETDEPTFLAGDDVMLLQYVLTNVGEEELILDNGDGDFGIDFVGNDYVSVPEELRMNEALLSPYGLGEGSTIDHTVPESEIEGWEMPFAPGISVTRGATFWHPEGEELLVDFRLYRFVDGESDYDDRVIDATVPLTLP